MLNEDMLRLRDLGRGIVVAKLDYKCAEVQFDLVTVVLFIATISDCNLSSFASENKTTLKEDVSHVYELLLATSFNVCSLIH